MNPFNCEMCGSLLAKTETDSKFEVKCHHCKYYNKFILGTNYGTDRFMGELDFERAEKKRNKRKDRSSFI